MVLESWAHKLSNGAKSIAWKSSLEPHNRSLKVEFPLKKAIFKKVGRVKPALHTPILSANTKSLEFPSKIQAKIGQKSVKNFWKSGNSL